MKLDWTNLYPDVPRGVWLRGNLHLHLGEGMELEDALPRYARLGYDFLCVSDHMKLTRGHHRTLLLIPGLEWNSATGEHLTVCSFDRPTLARCVSERSQPRLLRYLDKRPALVVLNHPSWREPAHYSREDLMDRQTAAGLEIYNGLVEDQPGTALATDKWDYLLSRGRQVFGFASDDAHQVHHIGRGWIWVRAQARTPRAVYEAILAGRFYASTGVRFTEIGRQGMRVTVASPNAEEIWAVGPWSRRLARIRGRRMVFDFEEHVVPYVRFTAFGRGADMGWTQPFFRDPPVKPGQVSPFVTTWWLSRLMPRPVPAGRVPSLSSPLDWKPIQAAVQPEGFVNIHARHGQGDGIAYLANRFQAPQAGPCLIALGHDGGAQLFLDGARVIAEPRRVNPAGPDRSRALVNLTRGPHEIVVALDTDRGLGQGIFLRFIKPESVKGPMRFPRRLDCPSSP